MLGHPSPPFGRCVQPASSSQHHGTKLDGSMETIWTNLRWGVRLFFFCLPVPVVSVANPGIRPLMHEMALCELKASLCWRALLMDLQVPTWTDRPTGLSALHACPSFGLHPSIRQWRGPAPSLLLQLRRPPQQCQQLSSFLGGC